MISREEYFRRVLHGTVRDTVQTLVRTKEFSPQFLTRKDTKEVDKEIDRMAGEVVDRLIARLKKGGYLEGNKDPPQQEFESMFREVLNQYIGEVSDSEDSNKEG